MLNLLVLQQLCPFSDMFGNATASSLLLFVVLLMDISYPTRILALWYGLMHFRPHFCVFCSGNCLQCALLGSDSSLCLDCTVLHCRCWSQTLTGDGVLCVGRFVSLSVGPASTSVSLAHAFVTECATRCWWLPLPSACPPPSAHGPRP